VEATEAAVEMDGTIEGAIASLIEPEETLEDGLDDESEGDDGVEDDEQEPDSEEDDDEESDEEQDDSEDDEEDTDDAVQSGQTHSVKIDGEEVSVTLEELKQGYSGQKSSSKVCSKLRHSASKLKRFIMPC